MQPYSKLGYPQDLANNQPISNANRYSQIQSAQMMKSIDNENNLVKTQNNQKAQKQSSFKVKRELSTSTQYGEVGSLSIEQLLYEPKIKLTHIQDNHYFLLINKKYQKALRFPQSSFYETTPGVLEQVDEDDIQQVFQVQKNPELQDKYQIVHGISTLIFQYDGNQVKLAFGKWKANQFFYPMKVYENNTKLQYWLKTSKTSNNYIYYDDGLKCGTKNPQDIQAIWEIRLCQHNKRLNKSCWIQNAFSNKVIDVPQATNKSDANLIQYSCNYRFNQRFNIVPQNNRSYLIQSIKTRQYLTAVENTFSTYVIQQPINKKDNQLWKIQYLGAGLYMIRSTHYQNLYLAVKDRSNKQCQNIILTSNETDSLWKIVGNFTILPNKDFKF